VNSPDIDKEVMSLNDAIDEKENGEEMRKVLQVRAAKNQVNLRRLGRKVY